MISTLGSCDPLMMSYDITSSHQEQDCHGNTVQERVEQAMEEIKDRKAYLEKRGRSEVDNE